ncbi:MAG: alpha-glucan family phosphorylase [Spirochaetales bacterium]|jgi:glycogen phosphorylase|nr:alpha-glucan family phosphorylase [Spirochaetales bacterium]
MKILTYRVRANLPENLRPLEEIAYNLWFSWNFNAITLFMRMDYEAWKTSEYNPAKALGLVSQERLQELSSDDSFVAALGEVHSELTKYNSADPWQPAADGTCIAYFSMEYGLDHCLPMYSGGLGILSGDHLKTASDLGLPLVAVGLLYRRGYFRQYLNADGYQQENYPEYDWYNMPVHQVRDENERHMRVNVDLAGSTVSARVWRINIGRTKLYLLDTNAPENTPEQRDITATLYGGDRNTRIQQEIVLGIGGIHLLKKLGLEPTVFHINEGHSAFLSLERIRTLMEVDGLTYDEAARFVWSTSVFTTHTPVPAGNERFSIELMKKYFVNFAEKLGLSWDEFLALGRENPGDKNEEYCMTVLALKLAAHANGVSELHGAVSRRMWQSIWPGLLEDEIPISHITNGVHPRTWVAHEMLAIMDRYYGPRFKDDPSDLTIWKRVGRISDEELWRAHERRREHMVAFIRKHQGADILSPSVLTITVARRFATYKRSQLLLRDPERLIKLLTDKERPIQLIFGGKAHPRDLPGKELIREIFHFSNQPEVRSRVVFVENYDIQIAKYLTSGSDVWLNTPRRTLEASGTSGMKASMNGVLNVSILDGWWEEGYDPAIGWAIGSGEQYDNENMQDDIESKALYDLLEREIVPAFYDRGVEGLPTKWISKMKGAISQVGEQFASQRMLMEYNDRYYMRATESSMKLRNNGYGEVRDLSSYLRKVRSSWDKVAIVDIESDHQETARIGETLKFSAKVELGELKADEVLVELVRGTMTAGQELGSITRAPMAFFETSGGTASFSVEATCMSTGLQGFSIRVLPKHPALSHPFIPGLVKWANGEHQD